MVTNPPSGIVLFKWEISSDITLQISGSEHPDHLCLWPSLNFQTTCASRQSDFLSSYALIWSWKMYECVCFQINPGLSVPSIYNFHLFPANDVLAPLYNHELQQVGEEHERKWFIKCCAQEKLSKVGFGAKLGKSGRGGRQVDPHLVDKWTHFPMQITGSDADVKE